MMEEIKGRVISLRYMTGEAADKLQPFASLQADRIFWEGSRALAQWPEILWAHSEGTFSTAYSIWAEDRLAGFITLNHIDVNNRSAGIQYFCCSGPKARSHSADAIRTLLRYTFQQGFVRISGWTLGDNDFAHKSLLRLGFVQEGQLRAFQYKEVVDNKTGEVSGMFIDYRLYSMLVTDWKRKYGEI